MKRLFTLVLPLLSLCAFGQTPVTFNVNMLPVGPSDNLHIVGNFQDPNYDNVVENSGYQNWSPSASSGLMSDPDMDLIYSVTLFLLPGRYEFFFINGDDWPSAEEVPQACTVDVNGNTNRQIMVASEPVTYSVCYGECADCGQNSVRLRVDMSTVDEDGDGIGGELGEDIHPDGVHVNGSFVNWGSFVPMQDWDGNNVWEGLMILNSADPVQYKYINGPSWDFPNESIFGPCSDLAGNRNLTINEMNTVLPVNCWNSCDPCTQPVPITFSVDMNSSLLDTSPGVRLMGTVTDWANGALMSDDDGDGIWTIALNLQVGTYEYKYRIGTNGWEGIGNRELTVIADNPQILPTACFNSIDPCDPNVQIGCTIPNACNFDPSATLDDGSCIIIGSSCDDNNANTFNDVFDVNCGCIGTISVPGCMDPGACNFAPTANTNDDSCTYPGCTSNTACNFQPLAGCDNGSCMYTGTTCNDNNPGTMLDQVNGNCNCQGTPFNYGTIATTTTNLCSGVAPQAINLSVPLNLQSYAIQWYYRDGANPCPSGNSTAGWNILPGANNLSYSPTEFVGTRTYACFISPSGIYGIPAAWANGCRTISYYAFDAQAIIGNPNITPFSTVTYAVNPIAGHTYNWAVTNGAITSGQGTSVITILWGQNGPYQVALTESNGICSDVSSLVVVNSNCSISVSAIAEGGNSFCPGSSTTLQAVSDATGITYQWYYNGSAIPGATDASVEISSGGNYQALITQGSCTAVSQTLFITTLPAVIVPQLSINSSTPGCSGGTVIISAEGGTFDSYLWNNGETTSTIEVSTSGDYSVDLADANGCNATAGPVSVNLALQEPLPICIVSVDPTTNNNIIVWEPLESNVTSAYAIYKETNIADEYVSIGTVNYGSDGLFTDLNSNASVQASRYKLALIDTCGIESFLTPQHKTIHLTSNMGLNNTVNLIWSHYEGFFFGSYNIYRGDAANNLTLLTTIASNLNSYTDLNPLAGAAFYVIEVEGISCDPTRDVVFSRSNVIQFDANAVMEKSAAHCFVWPNPGNDKFNLRVDHTMLGSTWLVRNMLGQEIASFQTPSILNAIDASYWAPGVYLLEQKNNSGSVLRLVKK